MKKDVFKFEFGRPKTRNHKVLFVQDTPFKPKRVDCKITYKRKPKHQKKSWGEI